MLLVIGGRYLVFGTVYGMRLYWALGLALASAGFSLAWLGVAALVVVAAGAVIEAVFGVACIARHRGWQSAVQTN
jgi:hypothetical protein